MSTAEWLAFGTTLLIILGSFAAWMFSKLETMENKIIVRAESTEYPRGVLLDGVLVRAVDPSAPPTGTYAPGDLCLDKTGGPARTPSERFGIGAAWRASWVYRVGDVVAPGDGHAYVCSVTASSFGSRGGDVEPTWSETTQDGAVTWMRWGPDSPRWP